MVRVSVLNDALKTMYNAEKRGKRQVLLRPSSKVVIKFLQVMMRHGEALLHSTQTTMPMASVALLLACSCCEHARNHVMGPRNAVCDVGDQRGVNLALHLHGLLKATGRRLRASLTGRGSHHSFLWTGISDTPARWTYGEPRVLAYAGYIGEFEFVDDHRGGKLVVELNGR